MISADDHITEGDLWIDRVPAKFRDRAPRVTFTDDGHAEFAVGSDVRRVPGIFRRPQLKGAWDAAARVSDMDADGIDHSLLFHGNVAQLFGKRRRLNSIRAQPVIEVLPKIARRDFSP